MNKQVEVLLGHFTFIEPTFTFTPRPFTIRSDGERIYDVSMNSEGGYKAIIHRIDNRVWIDERSVDKYCEDALDKYEGYLIPTLYNGTIEWELN